MTIPDPRFHAPAALDAWRQALYRIDPVTHGISEGEVVALEAFWHHPDLDSDSAGFVVRLENGARAYIGYWREAGSIEVEVERLPEGKLYPEFPTKDEPLGGWRYDVDLFNEELAEDEG